MKILAAGKQRLDDYIKQLGKLHLLVAKKAPINEYLIKQINSLKRIMTGLREAYDFSFELSLVNNAKSYFADYQIVNEDDGSWAVAISDENSLILARLTKDLFADFKNNLTSYVDLPIDAKEISFGPIKLAYTDPKKIIQSAIDQMEGAIQFYNYLKTEEKLLGSKREVGAKIPNTSNVNLAHQSLQSLIRDVSQLPSSYLLKAQNSSNNGVSRIMENPTAGLGHQCMVGLRYFLEQQTLATLGQINPLQFSQCLKPSFDISILSKVLNNFIELATEYIQPAQNHADYKKRIISELKEIIENELAMMATEERLHLFYNDAYQAMYLENIKLVHLQKTRPTEDHSKQQKVLSDAIHQYLLSPGITKSLHDHQEMKIIQRNLNAGNLMSIVSSIEFIISELVVAIPVAVHNLLKKLTKLNLEHVRLVLTHGHTLSMTGDLLNNLSAFLLSAFTRITIADEPITHMRLKFIEALNALSLDAIHTSDATPQMPKIQEFKKPIKVGKMLVEAGGPVFRNSEPKRKEELSVLKLDERDENILRYI